MAYLKLADLADIPVIVSLAHELYSASVYKTTTSFDQKAVFDHATEIISGPKEKGCIILLNGGEGFIACSTLVPHWSPQTRMAVELAFWIKPELRTPGKIKALIKAYRYWARKIGCTSMVVGKLKNMNEVETYVVRKL